MFYSIYSKMVMALFTLLSQDSGNHFIRSLTVDKVAGAAYNLMVKITGKIAFDSFFRQRTALCRVGIS
jgi:hypothetical protein